MRRSLALLSAGLIIVGVLGPALANAVAADPPPPFRMARVALRQDSLELGGAGVAAWVPTGSQSRKCLVTLLESTYATYGQTIYCGLRFVDGQPGVWIHIFFNLAFEPPPEFNFHVAVYQQGADAYGQPIPCPAIPPEDSCVD